MRGTGKRPNALWSLEPDPERGRGTARFDLVARVRSAPVDPVGKSLQLERPHPGERSPK